MKKNHRKSVCHLGKYDAHAWMTVTHVTLRRDSGRICSQVSKKAAVSIWQVLGVLATCDGVSWHSTVFAHPMCIKIEG